MPENEVLAESQTADAEGEGVKPGATAVASPEQQQAKDANQDGSAERRGSPKDGEGNEGKEPALTPVEEAIAASRKADLSRLAHSMGLDAEEISTVEELEAAIEETRTSQREGQTDHDVGDRYQALLADIDAELDKLSVAGLSEDNEEIIAKLTPAQKQAVINKVNGFRSQARELLEGENNEKLAAHVIAMFPDEAAAAKFVDAVKDGLDMAAWQRTANEHLAPHTKAWKARELEFATEKAKAKAEGFEEGKKAPSGQPSQRNAAGSHSLTSDEFAAMTEQQKAQVWRERPEEVRALAG